jgi:dihydroorotate dehydrogenase (NAD+) catalytic subunit
MVFQAAQTVSIPIIGAGGVLSAEDALEFLMAGASAVQVGTATFANPVATITILDDLAAWLEREGVRDIHEIIGAALPGR